MDHTPLNLKSKLSIILDLPPSCVEFLPLAPNYFVVGTYFLESNPASDESSTQDSAQTRSGGLHLYRLQNNAMYVFLFLELLNFHGSCGYLDHYCKVYQRPMLY